MISHELHQSMRKNSPERKIAANQLKQLKKLERSNNGYQEWRTGFDYKDCLSGIDHFLEYVKSTQSNVVLDIGTGSALGIGDLFLEKRKSGLIFKATGLRKDKEVKKNLQIGIGERNFYLTSAERLQGIASNSVGGLFGLCSIAYSESPHLTVRQIDRVGVPGAIFKGTFRGDDPRFENEEVYSFYEKTKYKTHEPFYKSFQELGYDIATYKGWDGTILVAIKPGNTTRLTAIDILRADKQDWVYPELEMIKKIGRKVQRFDIAVERLGRKVYSSSSGKRDL